MKNKITGRIFIVLFLILVFSADYIYADYNPVPGGDLFYDLLSPSLASSGSSLVTLDSPLAALNNPAASGFLQRFTGEIAYTAINGNDSSEGWGNIAAAGLSAPGKAGVLSSSLYIIDSNFSYLNSVFLAGGSLSYAKDLYENLSVGAGLNIGAGSSDWMLSLDLGFIHYPQLFLSDRNFRWAGVIKNLGKGFEPDNEFSPMPALYTPGLGFGINLFQSEKFEADFTSDILFPAVRNVKLDTGASFTFANSLKLSLSAKFDFNNINDNGSEFVNFAPTIGLSYGFKTNLESLNIKALNEREWNRTELITDAAVTVLAEDITAVGAGFRIPFGTKDNKGPSVKLEYDDIQYISPNNDGIQDLLVIPLKIDDERYVKGYSFTIYDKDGKEIRNYVNKEERPENITFKNILDRLFYVKSGIAVPEALVWDGTDNNRTTVPDGTYTFQVESWDDNGNKTVTKSFKTELDNHEPDLTIEKDFSAAERIFSPNNDGSKDIFTIRQSGSTEALWKGEIIDSRGTVVKTYDFSGKAPSDIYWDGKGDSGSLSEDGVYTYRITGKDLAGNSASGIVENIIISTIQTPAYLGISASAFSPNSDGVKDAIDFLIDVPVRTGVQGWTLDIISESDGKNAATFEGLNSIPYLYTFDGRTGPVTAADGTAAAGSRRLLAEGVYRGKFQVIYENGNMPEVLSPRFIIDITPPAASVMSEYPVFSPNNDGSKDTLSLKLNATSEEVWKGKVSDDDGKTRREFSWKGTVPSDFKWGGTDSEGKLLPDGKYFFELSSSDAAGNSGSSGKIEFFIDTEETPVLITGSTDAFSPNSDGVKDSVIFYPQIAKNEGIENYSLTVNDKNGRTVYKKEGKGPVPRQIAWDGKDESGKITEGLYKAEIVLLYVNGNKPSSSTAPFTLDVTYPVITLETDYLLFSPDGDGKRDSVPVKMLNPSAEKEWLVTVYDTAGKIVNEKYLEGRPSGFTWDGKDRHGNLMKNGFYGIKVQSEDAAGNRTVKEIKNIELDNRPTTAIVSVERDGFSPNSDNLFDTIRFDLISSPEVPVDSWSLDIISSTGTAVKRFTGSSAVPGIIIWDGKADSLPVKDDNYTAELTVGYKKGDIRKSGTRSFALDTTPPAAEVVLSPYLFSPDNDGVDDELDIRISLKDRSGIKDWKMEISDPYMNSFRKFSGRGMPSGKIVWDGMSEGGELVQAAEDYPYTLTASDTLGNIVTASGIIPIDVLVVRDGNNLKIKISSINFSPNSPELVTDIPEIKEKNEKIIDRLAEILNKYSAYKIKIEGHANNMSWYDPVKAAKEQKEELLPLSDARCETVKKILTQKGVSAERMSKQGVGGSSPVVPFEDAANRWKNRRVEFILIK